MVAGKPTLSFKQLLTTSEILLNFKLRKLERADFSLETRIQS
jgi:hypothetical protein